VKPLSLPHGFTTRFAPAPTGYLHLGHIVNAVWVWGLARAHGGRVLLRLEDHDRGRCRAEYEQAILNDLDWLGFTPDGATTDTFRTGAHSQRQSDNRARYEMRLTELESRDLAYPCSCSRADIARANGASNGAANGAANGAENSAANAEAPDGADGTELRYPGTCRSRALDPASTPARRIRVNAGTAERFNDLRLGEQVQDPNQQCGDFLARDRHGNFTYQFCVVVDDLEQGVDVVIRGEDLLDSTGRQLRLARMLGRTTPPRFLHHPLIRHPDGRKLSKSAGDTGVRELRAAQGRADPAEGVDGGQGDVRQHAP
jgi:glutamyl-tRNA synthetase/glutamyl-Q tRNA(Asp) synthetase